MSVNPLRASRTKSTLASFILLNEPQSQVLKISKIKFVMMFICLNRCKETEDPVQSSRITAHPDSSPTPNRTSRGSLQEPTAMDNTLILESRVAPVSSSYGLKSIYTTNLYILHKSLTEPSLLQMLLSLQTCKTSGSQVRRPTRRGAGCLWGTCPLEPQRRMWRSSSPSMENLPRSSSTRKEALASSGW